jgi:general secretion pathway protein G
MLACAVLAILAAIAFPAYSTYVDRANVTATVRDLTAIQNEIERFNTLNGRFPATLAEINLAATLDPWGRPYAYLSFEGARLGQMRKDRNLVPINTDYDLYSAGKDGDTVPPLTARPSRDDVVRARDGSFFGLGEEF